MGGTAHNRQTDAEREVLGRDSEIAALTAVLDAGRSVLVVAPGGFGKTSTVEAALREGRHEPARGAGLDFLQSQSYVAVTMALGRPPRPGDAAAVADEVATAVGADRLLWLDDLQWADDDTISALPWLAEYGQFVGCVRPGGDRADRVLKECASSCDVIELAPLDAAAAEALVARWNPQSTVHERAAIASYTGGIPIAVVAVARSGAGAGAGDVEGPLQAVLASWSAPMIRCLAAAYLDTGDDLVEADGAAELIDAGWARVDTDGHLRSVSDVLAELALDGLAGDERIALHRRAAESATFDSVAARHWLDAGEPDRAYRAATAAAADAATLTSRADLLVLALQCAPEGQRAAIAHEAGIALLRAGGHFEVILDWHRALTEPLPVNAQIEVTCLYARRELERHGADAADPYLREALSMCSEATPLEEYYVRVIAAAAEATRFDVPAAFEHLDRALELADLAGRSPMRAETLRLMIRAQLGDADAFRDVLPFLGSAAADDEPQVAFEAGIFLSLLAVMQLRTDEGYELLDRVAELAVSMNHRTWQLQVETTRATHDVLRNADDGEAFERLEARCGDPAAGAARTFANGVSIIVHAWHGRLDQSRKLLDDARARAGDRAAGNMWDWAAAEVAWLSRDTAFVPITAGTVTAANTLSGPACAVFARWARLEAGGDVAAGPAPVVIVPAVAGYGTEADALEALGTPGRELEAVDMFMAAAVEHSRYLARAALRCRWAAAEAARRGGDRETAVALLGALRTDCLDHHQLGLLSRIDDGLRLCGVRTDRGEPDRRVPLTRRQCDVLELLAGGLSTAATAQRLGITDKTVNAHVEASMRRLGAANRVEAVHRYLQTRA